MRSPARARERRRAVRGASAAAAVVVAAAVLAVGCGGGGHGGDYVAIDAVGDPAAPDAPADPTGGVRLVPLDGQRGSPGGTPGSGGTANDGSGTTSATGPPDGTPGSAGDGGTAVGGGSTSETGSAGGGAGEGRSDEGGPGGRAGSVPPASSSSRPRPQSPAPVPTSTPPGPGPSGGASGGPAALSVSEPVRARTDRRWCEDVTLTFVNSGGRAVGSGTVTFGAHVVDALGTDWATRKSTVPLPAPLAAGTRTARTWTVCVDAWRVPLGMHIETRDVAVRWE